MLTLLWNFTAFIFSVGILITVHECGHFLLARYWGVKVERFSIGFGKTLWSYFDRKGTEYIIAMIPLGGYVKMLDKCDENVSSSSDKLVCEQNFNQKTVLQRISIIAAGPMANFIFAIFAYWVVFLHGITLTPPIVGNIKDASIASKAHIIPGMEIKSIDGIKTPDWQTVRMVLLSKVGEHHTIITVSQLKKNGLHNKKIYLNDWRLQSSNQDPLISLGIYPRGQYIGTTLGYIQLNSPASNAGLKIGDKIISVDGIHVLQWEDFSKLVHNNPKKNLLLEIVRDGKIMTILLKVGIKTDSNILGFAGVLPSIFPLHKQFIIKQYGPIKAIRAAILQTWQFIKLTFIIFKKFITLDVSLRHLGGPISIAKGAGLSAEYGIIYYLMFLALISINLGIMNLLPLPVLDGGHLLFLVIEKIKGKPVSERIQNLSYRIGSLLLIILMLLALFNDFSRLQ